MRLLGLLLAAVVGAAQPEAPPARILFIGNSLTYANDLPGMVCALARSTGLRPTCEAVARPDFSLEDHWRHGEARQAIARGWDVVVLQQGPSAQPASRRLLIEYTKRFDAEIRAAGARTAIAMVWPSRARRGDFAGVRQSYSAAARAIDGVLIPSGDAWRAAWDLDGDLALYGPDGFHPSPQGTYLAALTTYRQLFGTAAPMFPVLAGDPSDAPTLQRAVEETVARIAR
jgi:hypothetical protein